jgi:hypothetical protein
MSTPTLNTFKILFKQNKSIAQIEQANIVPICKVEVDRNHVVSKTAKRNAISARFRIAMTRLRNYHRRNREPIDNGISNTVQHIPVSTLPTFKAYKDSIALSNKFALLAEKPMNEALDGITQLVEEPAIKMMKHADIGTQMDNWVQYRDTDFDDDARPPFLLTIPEREVLAPPGPTLDGATQTVAEDCCVGTDDLELQLAREELITVDSVFIKTVSRSQRLALKDKVKKITTYRKLYYHLKAKHLFAVRSMQLLLTMRSDARIWMLTNGFDITTEVELEMMGDAVIAAFKLHALELKMRYAVYKEDIHNIAKHADAMSGKYTPGINSRGKQSPLMAMADVLCPWQRTKRLPGVTEKI